MKRTGKKRKLHSDERILLLLWEHSGKRELWDVPREITQKGISSELDILENNVSRSLKRLVKDDLVESELKHVKGEKRRQKAYFATRNGEEVQSGILRDLERIGISVIMDGEEIRMSIPSAHRRGRERGLGMSMVEIYLRRMERDLPLDLSPGWVGGKADDALFGSYQLPSVFYGREEEIEEVLGFQRSTSGVLVIWGLAGMGKTSLILKAMSEAGVRAGYTRCESWTDSVELMSELGSMMREMGLDDAAEDLNSGELSPGRLGRTIGKASSELNGLTLIIDDLQKTGGGIDVHIEGLCRASMDNRTLKVIILTRERPSFLDPRLEIHGSLRTMELKGLDPRSVGLMIKALGKGGDIGTIWDITKGHPLFIELYMSSEGSGNMARFAGFLEKEIFSPLSKPQKRAVQLAALSGQSVHRTLFGSISPEDLGILKRKGLLKEPEDDLYFLHDLLSDHVLGTIGPRERGELVKEIISYRTAVVLRIWDDGSDLMMKMIEQGKNHGPDRIWSMVNKKHSSIVYEDVPGLRTKFRPYLDSNISLLIDIGSREAAMELLEILSSTATRGRGQLLIGPIMRMERTRPTQEQMFSLRLQRASLEIIEGDVEGASKTIRLIEVTYPDSRIRGKDRAKLQHIKGKISRAEKNYGETIGSHRKALDTYLKIGDRKGAARERLHLAKALHQGGKTMEAYKQAIKSASDFEEVLDRKGEVYACLQAFRSALLMGKDGSADKCLGRALDVSGSIGDIKLLTLVDLERMLHGSGGPNEKDIRRFQERVEDLDAGGLLLAIKGFLKLSEGYPVAENIERKAQALMVVKRSIEELGSRIKEDEIDMMIELGILRTGLLEQSLELSTSMENGKLKRNTREGRFPFIIPKGKDPGEVILIELIDEYENLIKLMGIYQNDMDDKVPDIDGAYEGLLHSYVLAGIHFRGTGKMLKARKMFTRCRKGIAEYERSISGKHDRPPGFDLRTVKKVLEENRSLLEEGRK